MTRKLPFLAFFVLLIFAFPASAPADYANIGKRCKRVVFTPQSDDVADNIYKREISCKRARRIVRIVRRKGDLTPMGFTCRYRAHDPDNGLGHTDFRCTNSGNRRVSWAQY
jgi:hypothetical protein